MPVVRPTRINIDVLHRAKANLQANQPLSYEQRKVLLDLIQDGERVLYPTQMDRDRYHYHFDQYFKVATESDEPKLAMFSNEIIAYEQKYCKP